MSGAKIAVIYSSTYGHVRTLAEKIADSARSTGAEIDIYQFPEILSDEVLKKMHAPPKAEYPLIKPDQLAQYDGFLFGIPTRYGRAVGAASAFFDQTGSQWSTGALVGKFAGIFTSSASQHGGQETTALTTLPFLAHHGIMFVPIGFAAKELSDNSEVVGGSAWGAAAVANGDGSRQLSEKELAVAHYQGTSFAKTVATFVAGKTALEGRAPGADVPTVAQDTTTTATSAPAAAKAVPASATTGATAEPYDVPATESKAAPPPTSSSTETPAAAPTPVPAAQTAAQKPATAAAKTSNSGAAKKGSLFASCCGGSAKNYDS